MAKKKIDTSKLKLGVKRSVKKTTTKAKAIDNDEVVKKIHKEETKAKASSAATQKAVPKKEEVVAKENTKRVTLDIPVSLHKRIKMHVFNIETTMKKYFLELAEKDIDKNAF